MQKLLRFVGVGACALSLVAVAGIAFAQQGGFDDFGGSIFDSVSIDLKVNGQDGPVTVAAGSRIVVSWISEGAARCRGNWSKKDIKTSGTIAGRISKSVVIKAACIDKEGGNRDDDSVVVNVEGKAPIVTQPTPTLPPQPTTSAQPTIIGLKPESGTIGSHVQVKIANFSTSSTNRYYIGFNNATTDTSVGATISSDGIYLTGVVPSLSPGQYNVSAGIYGGILTKNWLTFTITAPTTSAQPTITVLSPNGGETYKAGDLGGVRVNWTTQNISRDALVNIELFKGNTSIGARKIYIGFDNKENDGTEYIILPSTLTPDNDYYIHVSDGTNFDSSDKPFTITAPAQSTSGNVGTGNVGVATSTFITTTTTQPTSSVPPKLSATAPTISGTRTAAGDKLYSGSMSITATISNSGGALTTPVSARFQYSTNEVNWYDFQEVGPVSATPRNVSHSWEGGVGTFSFRLCIGTGTDNCSPSSSIEIVPTAGAFIGLSRELAAAGVPDNDVWAFVKRWLGR